MMTFAFFFFFFILGHLAGLSLVTVDEGFFIKTLV